MFDPKTQERMDALMRESMITGVAAHATMHMVGPAPALIEAEARARLVHVVTGAVREAAEAGLRPEQVRELLELEGLLQGASYVPDPEEPEQDQATDVEPEQQGLAEAVDGAFTSSPSIEQLLAGAGESNGTQARTSELRDAEGRILGGMIEIQTDSAGPMDVFTAVRGSMSQTIAGLEGEDEDEEDGA